MRLRNMSIEQILFRNDEFAILYVHFTFTILIGILNTYNRDEWAFMVPFSMLIDFTAIIIIIFIA